MGGYIRNFVWNEHRKSVQTAYKLGDPAKT